MNDYRLRFAGEVVELVREPCEAQEHTLSPLIEYKEMDVAPVPVRGVVTEFSQRSRRRLAKACAAIPWGAQPFYFVTVTYPGQWTTDGRRVKSDLDALRKAWDRRWGQPLAVWKMEFQERGAPHFHLAIAEPLRPHKWAVMEAWLAWTWYRIVDSGDPAHLKAGTSIEPMIQPPTAYFSSHSEHGRDNKGYQNTIPDGYENAGRFWGFWNLAPDWNEHELTYEEFIQARRMMRRWWKATTGRRWYTMRPSQGQWLRTHRRPSLRLALDLLRAVEICTT